MKTAFILIIALFGIIYLGCPTISFKPFSISFEKPYLIFAAIFFIGFSICYATHYERVGFKKGVDATMKAAKEIIAEREDELNG